MHWEHLIATLDFPQPAGAALPCPRCAMQGWEDAAAGTSLPGLFHRIVAWVHTPSQDTHQPSQKVLEGPILHLGCLMFYAR